MYLLHPKRTSKIPALCKSKALKIGKKMINYCRAGFELLFLSSGWSNNEYEHKNRHHDPQTYCHSDWCLDRGIKQTEFIYIPRTETSALIIQPCQMTGLLPSPSMAPEQDQIWVCVWVVIWVVILELTSSQDAAVTRGVKRHALGSLSKSPPTQEVRQRQAWSAVHGSTLVSFSFT